MQTKPKFLPYVIFYGIFLSSFALVFGVGIGTFGTFFEHFIKNFPEVIIKGQETKVQGNISMCYIVGGAVAAFTGSFIYFNFGRYRSLMVMLGIEILAFFGMAIRNIIVLYVLRFVIGYICGFWLLLVPTMFNEIFPQKYADKFMALFGVFLTGGICCGYLFSGSWTEERWRLVLMWPVFLEMLKFFLFWKVFNMESPQWYIHCNCRSDMIKNFEKMYSHHDSVKMTNELYSGSNNKSIESEVSWSDIFSKKFTIQLLLGITLNILNQMTGINYFSFYIKDIFVSMHVGNAANYAIGFGLAGFFAAIMVILMLTIFSKRTLMLWGLYAQICAHFLMILGLAAGIKKLAIIGSYLYTYGYAHSLGGIMYPYCADILPMKAFPLCIIFQWILSCSFVKLSPMLLRKYGNIKMFTFFQICTVIGTMFFSAYSIKTEKKSEKEILKRFEEKKFLH